MKVSFKILTIHIADQGITVKLKSCIYGPTWVELLINVIYTDKQHFDKILTPTPMMEANSFEVKFQEYQQKARVRLKKKHETIDRHY